MCSGTRSSRLEWEIGDRTGKPNTDLCSDLRSCPDLRSQYLAITGITDNLLGNAIARGYAAATDTGTARARTSPSQSAQSCRVPQVRYQSRCGSQPCAMIVRAEVVIIFTLRPADDSRTLGRRQSLLRTVAVVRVLHVKRLELFG